MANDITFRVATESTKALNDFSKLTLSQQKMDLETKKLNQSLQKQSTLIDKNGKSAGKGAAPSGANITPFIPGGGGAEQFKQTLGALGISGLAGAIISLKNAIDTNTKNMLDKAKKEQDSAKKLGPAALFQGKDPRFQGEYQQVRNKIAQQTATPLEEIDKLNSSFSAIVSSAEDLQNIISSIAIASKLNLGSTEELIALEQKNIANGGSAGNAVADLTKLNTLTNGASQVKSILDEIALFKDQNVGFALGTNLIKTDAVNAEENMKSLAAFQEKGSNENLRSYMRIGDDVEGGAMFDKFFDFVNKKSEKLGMNKNDVIDNIVKRGDLDQTTGDALKTVIKDMDGLNTYLKDFSTSAGTSQSALEGMIATLDELKNSNVSFKDSFEADKRLVDAEIIKSSPDKSVNSTAFNEQISLTERARKAGLYTQLVNDEGVVPDELMNRAAIYNEENKGIPFVTGPSRWRDEAKVRNSKNIDDIMGGKDILKNMFQIPYDTFGIAATAPADLVEKSIGKDSLIRDIGTVGMEDVPVAGAFMTHKLTGGKMLPGMYDSLDTEGNKQSKFTLGTIGQLGLDVATLGGGGFIGRKVGLKSSAEIIKKGTTIAKKTKVAANAGDFVTEGGGVNAQLGNLLLKTFNEDADAAIKIMQETVTKNIEKTSQKALTTGIGSGELIRSTIEGVNTPREPARTSGGDQVYKSFEDGSRDKIDIAQPSDIAIKELGVKLDTMVEINKNLLKLQTDALDTQNKIKDNTANANQKPFSRNTIK